MEVKMNKKLLVALSLFSMIGLHGAAADILNKDSVVELVSSDRKIVHLPFSTENLEDNIFETINRLVEDLGIEDEHPIPMPEVNEVPLKHAINVYHDSHYQLPVTDKEQKEQNVTLPEILKALDFLDAKDLIKKFYTAWLNHPQNMQEEVHHHAPAFIVFNQMGLGMENLPFGLLNTKIALKKEDTNNINNHALRQHKHVSIQNLIDAHKINIVDNKLDLSGKSISSLEGISNLADSIRELDLSNNQITIIPKAFAELNDLRDLHLNNNQIATLGEQAFAELDNLNYLSLDNNQITIIPSKIFEGLNNLEYLNLNNNQIATLGEQAFAGLNNLMELSLCNNEITKLNEQVFTELKDLNWLHLHNNKIEKLDEKIFEGLSNLNNLTLNNNIIMTLNAQVFAGLNSLKDLNLGFNQITTQEKQNIIAVIPDCDIEF
ncbi:MAG: hypothetical protein ACJAZS_000125 [Alteromonas naphthalenivorans]|jgi:hypothetical protein